jgi:hypothetical protein
MDNTKQKIELLKKYSTSRELFEHLNDLINTLANDESDSDYSVGDDYNFGTDYDIELVLELISDLRDFTQYNHSDEDDKIITNNLQYLYPYFRG